MRSSTPGIRCELIVLLASLGVYASRPAAGQATSASIIGQMTDATGAVLPGVTVTGTSPAAAARRIVARLKERRALRPSAELPSLTGGPSNGSLA